MFRQHVSRLGLIGLGLVLPSGVFAQAAAPAGHPAPATQDWTPLSRPRTHAAQPTTTPITEADLKTRLYLFSDDSMGGRLVASPGNVKGVEYIAGELKKLGIEPAGENGTYFQTVGVFNRVFDPATPVSVDGNSFTVWTDFIPRDQGPGARPVDGMPVIYGGTWGDSTSLISPDLAAGKFVVFSLVPAGYSAPDAPGTANRGMITRRYIQAAGIAVVGLDDIPAANRGVFQQTFPSIHFESPNQVPTFLYVTRDMGAKLMGAPLAGLSAGTTGRTVHGAPRFIEQPVQYPARNVVGRIRGSDPALAGEYVAIGAHNDHIGTGTPVAHDSMYVVNHLFRTSGADDPPVELTAEQAHQVNDILAGIRRQTNGASARVDSIFNGADDDGSGSMGLLEIAQYFAGQRTHTKRSLLFIWHVGEEEGLWGSAHFTDEPTVPRDSIVAELNIDMIGRGAPSDVTGQKKEGGVIYGNPDYVQVIGSRRLSTELGDLAVAVDKTERNPLSFDYALDANGHPQNIYCRSDHYMYARYGIPIAFFTTGGHADYHQVTDEPQYIDYNRLMRVSSFIADLAVRVANLDHRIVVDQPKPDPKGQCQQ